MNEIIKLLIDGNAEFTKNITHNGDMWIINNIRDGVSIYFSLDGKFLYMCPNAL